MNWYEFLSRAWRCSEALKYKHNFKQIHDGYYAIFSDDDDDDDDDDEDDDDDSDDDDVVVDDTDDYYYDGLTKLELLRVFRVDLHAAALHPSCTRIKRYPSQEQLGQRPRNRTISVVIPTNWRHWYCLFRHVVPHMFWHLALLWYFMPHMLTCHLVCMYIYIYIYIYLEYPDLLFGTWSGMNKNIYSHILSEIFSGILTLTSLSGIRPG